MPIDLHTFFKRNHIQKDVNILLAFSAGVDSVVLAHLFLQAKISFSIAHCNFHLREEDSDLDESFSVDFAKQYGIPVFIRSFETQKIKEKTRKGTQELARELRYNWFEEIRNSQGFDLIATAHHANDQIETILYKFIKGTGLDGLSGMKEKNNFLVRPLLNFTKEDIIRYASENKLEWREDISNQSDKYARNRLRLNVIPELKKINEGMENTILNQAQLMEWHRQHYEISFKKWFENLENRQGVFRIYFKEIGEENQIHLSTLLHRFGFFQDDIFKIIQHQISESGKQIFSENYVLTVDRIAWILSEKKVQDSMIFLNENTTYFEWNGSQYQLEKVDKIDFFEENKMYLDFDKIKFPLKISNETEGVKWQPLGMKSSKKLSDFLIDEKVSVIDKKRVGVIKDTDNKIIALLDFRIAEGIKITEGTSVILIIKKLS